MEPREPDPKRRKKHKGVRLNHEIEDAIWRHTKAVDIVTRLRARHGDLADELWPITHSVLRDAEGKRERFTALEDLEPFIVDCDEVTGEVRIVRGSLQDVCNVTANLMVLDYVSPYGGTDPENLVTVTYQQWKDRAQTPVRYQLIRARELKSEGESKKTAGERRIKLAQAWLHYKATSGNPWAEHV